LALCDRQEAAYFFVVYDYGNDVHNDAFVTTLETLEILMKPFYDRIKNHSLWGSRMLKQAKQQQQFCTVSIITNNDRAPEPVIDVNSDLEFLAAACKPNNKNNM